jgi:hypothetical protein
MKKMGGNVWFTFCSCYWWCYSSTCKNELNATLALGSWPRQGFIRLRVERKPMSEGKVWRNEPSHSQESFQFGSLDSQWIHKFLEGDCRGQNSMDWRLLYIIRKLLKHRCLKWAHMTHLDIWNTKLWPKERSRVKLTIWLLTTKSWESTWLPYVQVMCHILLESSWQGLQLWFRPHLHRRFLHKVMGPQILGSPNFGNFRTWDFHLGVPKQNAIWMWASWRGTKYTIRGKVVASPKFGLWWILCVRDARDSS